MSSDHTDCQKRQPVHLYFRVVPSLPRTALFIFSAFPVWLSCFPTLAHKLFRIGTFVCPSAVRLNLLERVLNVCLAPCHRETNSDLRGTDFVGRVLAPSPILELLGCPSNVHGEKSLGSSLTQVWSLSCVQWPFIWRKIQILFSLTAGRRVICNLLISKPPGFFVWAMFLKSRKLYLAHSGDAWNGKDFGPNSVAWVGFKACQEWVLWSLAFASASVVTDEISEIESSGRGVNYKLFSSQGNWNCTDPRNLLWPRFLKISPWSSRLPL